VSRGFVRLVGDGRLFLKPQFVTGHKGESEPLAPNRMQPSISFHVGNIIVY
jgi:hypothetical protein